MDEFDKFYNKALKFLSFRPRSEKEIRDYLTRKKAESVFIEKIIKTLKEQNFLNDLEFANWWVDQRTRFKVKSLRLAMIELKQKGISEDIVEDQISNIKNQKQDDLERAKKMAESKIYKYKELSRQEVFKKLGSMLARRGFSYDVIKQSIDEVIKKVV